MSESVSKQITSRTYIYQTLFLAIGFAAMELCKTFYDAQFVGWFFFILLTSIGVQLGYREKGDRFTTINNIMMIVISLISTGLFYLFSLQM